MSVGTVLRGHVLGSEQLPCPLPASWPCPVGAARLEVRSTIVHCPSWAKASTRCREQAARSTAWSGPWPVAPSHATSQRLRDRAAVPACTRSLVARLGRAADMTGSPRRSTDGGRTDLSGGSGAGIEAVTDEHGEGVADRTQQLHGLAVRQAQQALLVHLQQPLPYPQPAVAPGRSRGAHLQETGASNFRTGPASGPSSPPPGTQWGGPGRGGTSPWK